MITPASAGDWVMLTGMLGAPPGRARDTGDAEPRRTERIAG